MPLSGPAPVQTVLWECDAGDGSLVAREVGHVDALLEIPHLDHRVLRARAENQAVRMELGTGQGCK